MSGSGSAAIDASARTFSQLCLEYSYVCHADLDEYTGVRGLRTSAPVAAGDPVLAVPWEHVLATKVSSGPPRHRVAAHHFTIANMLLERTSDQSDALWAQYALLLPRLAELSLPATMPATLLEQLEDASLSAEASNARVHVEQHTQCVHRHACNDQHWAVALARSRPYALPAPGPEDSSMAAPTVIALLPFIDMANHAPASHASCEVRGVGDGEDPSKYTAAELVALRDLAVGSLVTVDYGIDAQPPAQQFSDFGFVSSVSQEASASARAVHDFRSGLEHEEALLQSHHQVAPSDPRLVAVAQYRSLRKRAAFPSGSLESPRHSPSMMSYATALLLPILLWRMRRWTAIT